MLGNNKQLEPLSSKKYYRPLLDCCAVTPGISGGDTDLCNASVCFCQSKAFTVCQNNQWLLRCSFNSLLLQNKRTCSCGFSAHISISACWSKAFLSVHVKLIGIFARYVGFCQCRIVVEQNGARSGSCCGPKATPTVWKCCFWTAAYPQHGGCVPAVQHDTCCPSKWKEMDASGMPFSCGEQRCPCRDCCGNVNLRRKLLAVDKQRLGCRSSLRVSKRHVSHFAGNVELCRAEHPGGSAASSASAPALPGSSSACLENAAWSHRQAGGWFVLLGAPVVLGGQLCAAFLAGLQICSPSLTHPRSAGSLASAQLLWEEGAAVPGLPNPARENQLETLPEKSAIAQQHCEQNIHAAFYMLACKLQCK